MQVHSKYLVQFEYVNGLSVGGEGEELGVLGEGQAVHVSTPGEGQVQPPLLQGLQVHVLKVLQAHILQVHVLQVHVLHDRIYIYSQKQPFHSPTELQKSSTVSHVEHPVKSEV